MLVSVGIVVLLIGAAVFRLSPLWPGPALPTGATRLHIVTASPHLVPTLGCPAALLVPARIATSGDDLILVGVDSGETIRVVWPAGYAAWRLDGRAELLARDGRLVGREGDTLDGLGGGAGDDGTAYLCEIGG